VSRADLIALAPLLVLSAAVAVTLAAIAVRRSHAGAVGWTVLGLAATIASLPVAARVAPRTVTPLLEMDGFALFFIGLLAAGAIAAALLAHGWLARQDEEREELYVLLLLVTLGGAVLAAARHFAALFLGLETLTVALYAMVAYPRGERRSVEAGVKYLVLAGASSAFLLFGIALLYADLGTLGFPALAARLAHPGTAGVLTLCGLGLLLVGVGFKLSVVPFHLWTPDVYEGAPAPVTAVLATLSKGAMLAALVRFLAALGDFGRETLFVPIAAGAVASMFAGNIAALLQTNVKRILAYSSIAHVGYMLVAVLAGGAMGAQAVAFYLAAYFVTTLAAFGVIAALSDGNREAASVDDFRALYWRRPGTATVMTAALLSLAGIPLTAGFLGKYLVLAAGVSAAQWALVLILALNSVIGVYYYLRIVVAMIAAPEESPVAAGPRAPIATGIVLAVLVVLLVWIGVFPSGLQGAIAATVGLIL
jgi:NADH-quinone oxidoreductase subunit N